MEGPTGLHETRRLPLSAGEPAQEVRRHDATTGVHRQLQIRNFLVDLLWVHDERGRVESAVGVLIQRLRRGLQTERRPVVTARLHECYDEVNELVFVHLLAVNVCDEERDVVSLLMTKAANAFSH